MIHQVLIIPNYGHSGDDGKYTRGRAIPAYSETDLIESYLPSLIEELDTDNIRFQVMETDRPPGVKMGERFKRIERSDMVLHLAGGWAGGKQLSKNTTAISYASPQSLAFAECMTEDVAQWGSCYVFGHKAANPKRVHDPILSMPETIAISIEPYALNGPDLQEYMGRGRELGVVIARCVSGFLRDRGFVIPARSPVTMGPRY